MKREIKIIIYLSFITNFVFSQCKIMRNLLDATDSTAEVLITNEKGSWCVIYNVEPLTEYSFSADIQVENIEAANHLSFFVNGVELSNSFQPHTSGYDVICENWNSELNSNAEVCLIANEMTDSGLTIELSDIRLGKAMGERDVVINDFTVSNENANVRINWEVVLERHLNRYEIQKSINGIHWKTIGYSKSKQIDDQKVNYEFYDFLPEEGLNYYRLKMVRNTDSAFYTDLRTIEHIYFSNIVDVHTNPIEDKIVIATFESVNDLELTDQNGNVLYFQKQPLKDQLISLPNVASGAYYLNYKTQKGEERKELLIRH